jgi:hypothetical protein
MSESYCEGKVTRGMERTRHGLIRFSAPDIPGMTETNRKKSKAIYSITGPIFEPSIS